MLPRNGEWHRVQLPRGIHQRPQRGNKVTSAQADQLIASAQQIKAMLNCGN